MGQLLGRPSLNPAVEYFSNLPRRAVSNLWQVFNDIADGFGVTQDELQEICADLKILNGVSRVVMTEKSDSLFAVFDTDLNGFIDALEFLSTLAVLSGMRFNEIIEFILTCYDFDGTQMLSVDEVTLALRSTATGLCKLSSIRIPREEYIEQLVAIIFAEQVGMEVTDTMKLRISVLTLELSRHPDIRSWFAYFNSPVSSGLLKHDVADIEVDHLLENPCLSRTKEEMDGIKWSVRCEPAVTEIDSILNPWVGTVALLTPFQYANQSARRLPPDESVAIEWVYGYQGEKSRNNVRYNFQGDLVYCVSKYAVVYNFTKHEQSLFSGHCEEILCLAIHPEGQYVATGESGLFPSLLVWHSADKSVSFADKSFHRNGIVHVAFSPNGKLLAAIGSDPKHTLTVYQWVLGTMLFSSEVDHGDCLSCTILLDGTVAVGGDSYIYFWCQAPDREGIVKRRGNFSRLAAIQPILSMAQVGTGDSLVTGTTSGQLFLWVDCNCVRVVRGHEGPVNCMYTCPFGVLSGSRDHRIRLWTHRLEPGATFDCSGFGINPSIRSVCMSVDGTSILIGTKGANIFEISAVDGSDLRGGPLACGHSTRELTGLASHPSKHEFASVGNDHLLRVCDMNTKTTVKLSSFDAEARAVCYSPLGDLIVVGFGGGASGASKSGAFVVLNELDMTVLHEAHDSTSAVSVVSFSPDGETLAVGVDDGAIFLYSVQEEYELIGRCLRHDRRVVALDFSLDGEWLRSNSEARDLCFFNADDGSYQSNMSSMRDVQWATHTCLFSWHTKALHRVGFRGESLSAVQTCPGPSLHPFVVSGTSYGFIQLHSFPCIADDAEGVRIPAHADTVASLRFSFDSDRVLSAGMLDRAIVQWRRLPFPVEDKTAADFQDAPESEDFALEARGGSDMEPDFMSAAACACEGTLNEATHALQMQQSNALLALPAVPIVDIWRDCVVPPVNLPNLNTRVPDLSVRLEAVYGYKCQDLRNCVRYNNQDGIVFPCATLGVVMNRSTRAQRFFQIHTDAISAFACSRRGDLVATGQLGHAPVVAVWDSVSCQLLKLLSETQKNAISALCFSENSQLLATASLDRLQTITVYSWRHAHVMARFLGGSFRLLGMTFASNDSELVTCGVKDIKIWSNIVGKTPSSQRPILGDIGHWQVFLCVVRFLQDTVLGTADGNLYVLQGVQLRHAVKAHRSGVSAMDCSLDSLCLVSGGKDGAVRVWSQNYDCIKEITIDSVITSHNVKVRSVCFSADKGNVLVGTGGAEVFELSLRTGAVANGAKQPLLHGHGSRELWGLAMHPTKEEFVSAGDDNSIRIWDARNCSLIRTIRLDAASRALAYSPDGRLLAVGFGLGRRVKGKAAGKEGAFVVLSGPEFRILHEAKDSNEPIRVARFSPDGRILALGSDDAHIYTYSVRDGFSRRATISSHRAPLQSLDFSLDSTYLLSVDTTHRMILSEVASGINIPSFAALRDERWASWTSVVGWPVMGMWLSLPQNSMPCAAQRSWNGQLVTIGCNGRVHISHNPCPGRAGFVAVSGHAGPISQIGWLAGDGALITAGRKDYSLMQWRVLYDDVRESGDEGGLSCQDSVADLDVGHEALSHPRDSPLLDKPWEGLKTSNEGTTVICPPSDIKFYDETAPACTVVLEHLHGMRVADSRQMVRYNQDGCLVFPSSSLGVIYARETQTQIHYPGHRHRGPVTSLDVTKSGVVVATGDAATQPEVHLWDARTGRGIAVFAHLHKRGICGLSFAPSGCQLVTLGADAMHSVAVLQSPSGQWHDGVILFSCSVTHHRLLWCLHLEGNAFPVAVGGVGVVYYLRSAGLGAERHRAEFGKKRRIQPLLCAVAGDPEPLGSTGSEGTNERPVAMGECSLVTGTVSGHLYVWNSRRVVRSVTAHDSSVFALARVGGRYASAGKDGQLKIWSANLSLLTTTNLQLLNPAPESLSCFSLRANNTGSKLALGMRSGDLFEFCVQTESTILLLQGHCRMELHGICCNPSRPDEFATSGDDGSVRVWSISLKKCLRRVQLDAASRAIVFSPDGSRLIVGVGGDPALTSKDGAFFVLNSETLDVILEDRKARKPIVDIKYSPNGQIIAFGSREGKVFLHSSENYSLLRSLQLPSKRLEYCRLDFSTSGNHLRTGTSSEDLFYFNVDDGTQLTSSTATRDLLWSTSSCPLTWLSQGLRRPDSDRAQIVCSATNHAHTLIAASYQDGAVRLFRYPCVTQWGAYIAVEGVSSVCSGLCFSNDDRFLLVLDSGARVVMQFRIPE